MEPMGPHALRFRLEADDSLLIDWSDGHQSRYSPERLRRGCPCASCREERAASRSGPPEPAPPPPGSIVLRGISPVGRYGLAPEWGDGHSAGIYSWPVLRALCDCFACRLGRGEMQEP